MNYRIFSYHSDITIEIREKRKPKRGEVNDSIDEKVITLNEIFASKGEVNKEAFILGEGENKKIYVKSVLGDATFYAICFETDNSVIIGKNGSVVMTPTHCGFVNASGNLFSLDGLSQVEKSLRFAFIESAKRTFGDPANYKTRVITPFPTDAKSVNSLMHETGHALSELYLQKGFSTLTPF